MNLRDKSCILSLIERVALVLLLYKMITLIIGGGEQHFSTHIDRFVWEGMVYLGLALLVVFKVNLRNYLIYIPTVIYLVIFYVLLLKTGYKVNSPDLWMMDLRKGLAVATIIPLVVDSICRKRFFVVKELNWVKLCLFCLVYLGAAIVPGGVKGYMFFAFVLVYMLVSFEKERIEMFVVCLAVADVLASSVLSVKSLITHPYEGDERYYGAFTNLHGFGMFVGSGILCCFFLYIWIYLRFEKKKIYAVALTPITLFLLVVFYLINSRNALLGLIVGFIVAGWVFSIAVNKTKLFKRILLIVLVLGFLGAGMIVFLGMNYDKYSAVLEKIPQLNYLVGAYGRLDQPMLPYTDVFPEDSFLSKIDYFTNSRLAAWKVTIGQFKLFQGNPTEILVGENWYTNPHNTFLGYINCWGIIVGGLFLVSLIYAFVIPIKVIRNRRDVLSTSETMEIFAVLWFAYSFTIFMNEMLYLSSLYVIICLLLLSFIPRRKDNK